MKILRYLLPAAFVAVLGASGASAAAFPVQSTPAVDASQIEVQFGDRRGPPPGAQRKGPPPSQMHRQGPPPSQMHRRGPPPHMHRPPPPPRYVPGRRYNSAPHGWRRYGARPGDWRMRGCVMVGPMWFCP